MITVYTFGPIGDVCDPSPFCVKVEAYLRMTGLPYETRSGIRWMRRSPTGKLPCIEVDGKIIPDSALILDYLKSTYGDPLDKALSRTDKAIAHAFSRMLDEHLYWVVSYARWQLPENRAALAKQFFNFLPFPLNTLITYKVCRSNKLALYKQGIGRYSDTEILDKGMRDLAALSELLGSKPYCFGDEPTTFDAVAYGALAQILLVEVFTGPIFERARQYDNLIEYTKRMHQRYFQDGR